MGSFPVSQNVTMLKKSIAALFMISLFKELSIFSEFLLSRGIRTAKCQNLFVKLLQILTLKRLFVSETCTVSLNSMMWHLNDYQGSCAEG